jgi:PKHD-type hydroxylase
MSYAITTVNDFYFIPSCLPEEVTQSLRAQCEGMEENLSESEIFNYHKGETTERENTTAIITGFRKSKQVWIPTDSWIAGVMAHCIDVANKNCYGFDLTAWGDAIQYTVYEGKGSKYNWHNDTAISSWDSSLLRKLSISLSLSHPDEYEGGEFQIMFGSKMSTYKLPLGGAIIFPSSCTHRVRAVKSGIRRSLVGWYAGPKWR